MRTIGSRVVTVLKVLLILIMRFVSCGIAVILWVQWSRRMFRSCYFVEKLTLGGLELVKTALGV